MAHIQKRRLFAVMFCMMAQAVLLVMGGCRQKEGPARIVFSIEGEEFSDAQISIDGKAARQFTQTIIKSNGELFIDGQIKATLPSDSPQISKEGDIYSGTLDSLSLAPGGHTIMLSAPEGKTLQITATVFPGYHLVIYAPEQETLKWDSETFKATPGTSIIIRPHNKK